MLFLIFLTSFPEQMIRPFVSIFLQKCYQHFVMCMKCQILKQKPYFFFLAPICTTCSSPSEYTTTTMQMVLARLLKKIMCTLYSFFLLLHFFKRIFWLQNQENCSFGNRNGILQVLAGGCIFRKEFQEGVKLDSSSSLSPISFTFKMK